MVSRYWKIMYNGGGNEEEERVCYAQTKVTNNLKILVM